MEFNLDTVLTVLIVYVVAGVVCGAFLVDRFPKTIGTWLTTALCIVVFNILPIDVMTEGSTLYDIQAISSPGLVKDSTGCYELIVDNVATRPSTLVGHKNVSIVFVDDDNVDIEMRTHKYTEVISFITFWQYEYELVLNKKYMIWDIPRGDY
ncbi:MAG: hypothetical protein ACRCXX_04140 [Cetobacterium sp.]|uniref:hypothetical protein n=1 Tax=Cetobacterium sp. TaxID=2071632 RepID=UPI003F3410DD